MRVKLTLETAFVLICLIQLLFGLILGSILNSDLEFPGSQTQGEEFVPAAAVRGVSGDLWADVQIGKRDFAEITPREVVAYKVSAPGGVVVDRSVSPGRMYVWDSGNSRILGIDLANCYASASPCSADIVIGQPALNDYGACNQDASFQNYPNRASASAYTLCGIPEWTHTTLEDKTFVGMYVDSSGNLYVPDSMNNRVLKFNSPFTTDTVADDVWGQSNFTETRCNRTTNYGNPSSQPTAATLCFHAIGASGAAVTFDAAGNMWVADGGNNRVLRFPNSGGTISKTANLVLGQANFTTGGDYSGGSSNREFIAPAAVSFDASGRLFVTDTGNNRILVFVPPFSNNMVANSTFGTFSGSGVTSVQVDPDGSDVWTYENIGFTATVKRWNSNNTLDKTLPGMGNPGGGSIGIDAQGNILISTYVYGQDVHRLHPSGANYTHDKNLFSPPYGYNITTNRRFEHGAWMGVAVSSTQLIVADGRLLYWNNPLSLTNGEAADGYAGASSFANIPNPGYTQIKTDADDRLWAPRGSSLEIFQAPLGTGEGAFRTISSPLPLVGGGSISFSNLWGVAPHPQGDYVWVTEVDAHRVFRIRDPLGIPVVDVVLGQTNISGNDCNRKLVPQPNSGTSQSADRTMLCYPGRLSLDKLNNLYVSDHSIEAVGNWRLLMFSESMFPINLTNVMYAPAATKEFPRAYGANIYSHATFETAFSSSNKMVVGYNPYVGPRFIEYYNNPTQVNPSNPSDRTYAEPDGSFADFYNWPVAMTFDANDNLYAFDNNRGRVMIYRQPFGAAGPTPTASASPSPSASPIESPTPTISISPSASVTATVTPTDSASPTDPATSVIPTPSPTSEPVIADNPVIAVIDQIFGGTFLGSTGGKTEGDSAAYLPSPLLIINGRPQPIRGFECCGLLLILVLIVGLFYWKKKHDEKGVVWVK